MSDLLEQRKTLLINEWNRLKDQHKEQLESWTLTWTSKAVRIAGVCKYNSKTICLSSVFVAHPDNSFDDLKDTLLHEVAHALAGKQAKHGPQWRAVARSIGCSATRCHMMKSGVEHRYRFGCGCPKKVFTRDRVKGWLRDIVRGLPCDRVCRICKQSFHRIK
jgi:predicted SprT family Zn-dependent metalloprotease